MHPSCDFCHPHFVPILFRVDSCPDRSPASPPLSSAPEHPEPRTHYDPTSTQMTLPPTPTSPYPDLQTKPTGSRKTRLRDVDKPGDVLPT